jgi:hypothetical protein
MFRVVFHNVDAVELRLVDSRRSRAIQIFDGVAEMSAHYWLVHRTHRDLVVAIRWEHR